MMTHPVETQLALYTGGELGIAERWSVRRHLTKCPQCRRDVAAFTEQRRKIENLKAELPPELNWNRLADEMAGNIRVGLAAGEAIAGFDRRSPLANGMADGMPDSRPSLFRWNGAWALAAAAAVFTVAFWLNLPGRQAENLLASLRRIRVERIGTLFGPTGTGLAANRATAGNYVNNDDVIVEASWSSVQVPEKGGGSLSMLYPRSDGLTISVSMQGSARASYINPDTLQATINSVYDAQP
jgi:anti-sigma factor RsiW